jgi:hypothetical protein
MTDDHQREDHGPFRAQVRAQNRLLSTFRIRIVLLPNEAGDRCCSRRLFDESVPHDFLRGQVWPRA